MLSFDDLVDKLVNTAKEGVVNAQALFAVEDQEDDAFEGGI